MKFQVAILASSVLLLFGVVFAQALVVDDQQDLAVAESKVAGGAVGVAKVVKGVGVKGAVVGTVGKKAAAAAFGAKGAKAAGKVAGAAALAAGFKKGGKLAGGGAKGLKFTKGLKAGKFSKITAAGYSKKFAAIKKVGSAQGFKFGKFSGAFVDTGAAGALGKKAFGLKAGGAAGGVKVLKKGKKAGMVAGVVAGKKAAALKAGKGIKVAKAIGATAKVVKTGKKAGKALG